MPGDATARRPLPTTSNATAVGNATEGVPYPPRNGTQAVPYSRLYPPLLFTFLSGCCFLSGCPARQTLEDRPVARPQPAGDLRHLGGQGRRPRLGTHFLQQ